MFVWTTCVSCGAQCGATSSNAPKTRLTQWGEGIVTIDMHRTFESNKVCTAWTTFDGNPQDMQSRCLNCTRPLETHHGAKNFCFPFFMFGKCCECSEADGNIATLYVNTYGCPGCQTRIQQTFERRRREQEAEAERKRIEQERAIAIAEIERLAKLERQQREEDYAAARLYEQQEREAREKEPFAPLNWLRTYLEDVAPKPPPPPPPPQPEEARRGPVYMQLQGRGMAERWWGWQAGDPPSHL